MLADHFFYPDSELLFGMLAIAIVLRKQSATRMINLIFLHFNNYFRRASDFAPSKASDPRVSSRILCMTLGEIFSETRCFTQVF